MYKGFKVLDADSHMMEPGDIWDKYLDKRYRPWAPGGAKTKEPLIARNETGFTHVAGAPYLRDGKGGPLLRWTDVYAKYWQRKFDAQSYVMYMDDVGIDHMVLYPTAGLYLTAMLTMKSRQLQSPEVAAALYRAYNSWVHDFISGGANRLIGAGGVDLRDADAAAAEARRCVKELGMKVIFILPQPALGIPLHDPYYDVLWGTIEELGVPLGIHCAQYSSSVGMDYWDQSFALGIAAATFPMTEMLVFVSLAGGGVLERFPRLKVIFLEAGAGWVPFWNFWCDEKWEEHFRLGKPDVPHPPSFYFKRQCYVSGNRNEPLYKSLMESGFEDNVMTATDFPHPEDPDFPRVMEGFFDVQSGRLTEAQIRKMLWDNPARAYNIE